VIEIVMLHISGMIERGYGWHRLPPK